MVAAYVGLAVALLDFSIAFLGGDALTWRTFALGAVSAVAAWGRKSARTIIAGWLLGPSAEPPAADPSGGPT
jgi:hypothetical protein